MTKTIVITGASEGIGAAAARQLCADGHNVILVGRSPEKTARIAEELDAPYYLADFDVLSQVRDLGQKLLASHPDITVLINNAGGIMGKRQLTEDGFEKTFQVNHLASYLLTDMLLPTLLRNQASVIQTASIAAERYANLDINDLQNEHHYTPEKAYGDSKLANILFTRELHRRYNNQGLKAAAFHPGIVGTSFASDTTHIMHYLYHTPIIKNLLTITPTKGAETLVWLAEDDSWPSGEYFDKKQVAKSGKQAYDADLALQLWDKSSQLI